MSSEYAYDDLPAPPRFQPSPARSAIGNERLRWLLDLWNSKIATFDIPHFTAIQPTDFTYLLGHIAIIEPLHGGEDFLYRLFGIHLTTLYGTDYTGIRASTLINLHGGMVVMDSYRLVVNTREALLTRHWSHVNGRLMCWERLLLPYCNDEGSINRILVASLPDGKSLKP